MDAEMKTVEKVAEHEKHSGSKSRKSEIPEIDFDKVLDQIGSFGRFQIVLWIIVYYAAIPVAMNQVASIFLTATPSYRCRIPQIDDDASDFFVNWTREAIMEATTPRLLSTQAYDGCKHYRISSNCTDPTHSEICFTNETTTCDSGYIYDKSSYESTIVTEWGLVCDRMGLVTISTTVYFIGVFLSAPIGGNLADRIGRTKVMLICQILTVGVGIGCSYAPSLTSFVILRFIIALLILPTTAAAFVYMLEIVGDEWRTFVGITVQGYCAVGFMILSALSDRFRDWRQLQLAIALSSAIVVLLCWWIPESPRWLFSKGDLKKAKKISHNMARRNGKKLPDDIWEKALTKKEVPNEKFTPIELMRRPRMRAVTINICFQWFVVSTVYYGISLNIGSLSGDDRINNVLSGLCELLACPAVILTMDRLGRRPVLSFTLFVSGVACLVSTVAKALAIYHSGLAVVATTFGLLGKFAVSCSFAVVYNFTGELYPTVVRGTAVGTGSMAARIGSIVSPLIIFVQHYVPWLPSALFGSLSLVAGLTSLRLPETNNHQLTTTLEEAEQFYKVAERNKHLPPTEGSEKDPENLL